MPIVGIPSAVRSPPLMPSLSAAAPDPIAPPAVAREGCALRASLEQTLCAVEVDHLVKYLNLIHFKLPPLSLCLPSIATVVRVPFPLRLALPHLVRAVAKHCLGRIERTRLG